MGFLDNVERALERAVNGAFAKTFRSGVQPVEIASALKRQLEIGAIVVDRDRVLAPNSFSVRLAPEDEQRLAGMGPGLITELTAVVSKHAKRQHFQLMGPVMVALRADSSLTPGVVQIDAKQVEGSVSWSAALEVNGRQHRLPVGSTVLGRGSDADITLADTGTSRRHLEVQWNGSQATARDLGSTNGSRINGQRFREAVLQPDAEVVIGQTRIIFRLIPQAQPSPAAGPAAPSDATVAQPQIDKEFWQGI